MKNLHHLIKSTEIVDCKYGLKNIHINGRNILPFDVECVYSDCCVVRIMKWNIFNLDKNKYVSPIWFHWINPPIRISFRKDNIVYVSQEMVYQVRLNEYYNFITYDGKYLFNKWLKNVPDDFVAMPYELISNHQFNENIIDFLPK